MRKTKIHTNDRLIETDDGSYIYEDSYGERTEIPDLDSLYSWAAEEGIEIDEELEAWLHQEDGF